MFSDKLSDSAKYAVIAARYQGQWLMVRHRDRGTWEIPGGHLEPGEDVNAAAQRELFEETGALEFTLAPVCAYGVERGEAISWGMLFLPT